MKRAFLLAVVAAVALAGCGGSKPAHYTERQISRALGTTPGQSGCTVIVALTTPADVALYANAGDPVASNAARTAGVKFEAEGSASESACQQLFTSRLTTLK